MGDGLKLIKYQMKIFKLHMTIEYLLQLSEAKFIHSNNQEFKFTMTSNQRLQVQVSREDFLSLRCQCQVDNMDHFKV